MRLLGQRQRTWLFMAKVARSSCLRQFPQGSQVPLGWWSQAQMDVCTCSGLRYRKRRLKFGGFTTFIVSGSKPAPWGRHYFRSDNWSSHSTWIKSSQYLAFLAYPARICRDTPGPWQTVPPNRRGIEETTFKLIRHGERGHFSLRLSQSTAVETWWGIGMLRRLPRV